MFLYFSDNIGLKFRALSVEDFLGYEASLVSVLGIRIDKIRKEEELEHQKDDGKLDEDDGPERLAQGHRPETIVIEMENPGQQSLLHFFLLHNHSFFLISAANLQ